MYFKHRSMHQTLMMVGLATIATLGLAARTEAQSGVYGGYRFFLTNSAENWTSAEAEAVTDGGHLASITSQAEQDFINGTFLTASEGSAVPYWIGATDAGHEPNYTWTDGSAFSYTNYAAGEPNNAGGVEHYLTVNWEYSLGTNPTEKGQWNDVPLNGSVGYGGNSNGPYFGIVEVPVTTTPEPSAVVTCVSLLGVTGSVFLRRRRRAK